MQQDLADITAKEEAAIKAFEGLAAAKTKEIAALTAEIEDKTARLGENGVKLVNLKEDLEDTEKALGEDKAFLADLDKNCATKEAEWAERQKLRAQELLALHETIQILNDDDALDLFKKTLPTASLLQMALKGKKVDFAKVITMIDEMVVLLGKEQAADDEK